MIKAYLSGRITGLSQEQAVRNFYLAELAIKKHFKDEVLTIVNPASFINLFCSWEDAMIADLQLLKNCNCIVMIKGWDKSKGAKIELEFAKAMGMEIVYLG